MQTSLCTGGMLKYACLHVQDVRVEVVHVLTSFARTVNKLKGVVEGLKPAQGLAKSNCDCSSTRKSRGERHQNNPSPLSKAHLSITVVKTSYLCLDPFPAASARLADT